MHVTFEDILEDVGGFGKFQKLLVTFFLVPTAVIIPIFAFNSMFWTSTPDHWCNVQEVSNSNLSIQAQRQLISPPKDHHCSMYDINYTNILGTGNYTPDLNWPTRPCDHGWQYDTENYDSTAVTKWNLVCEDDHYPSLILTLNSVGFLIGTPLFGYLSDKFGRKPTFLLLSLLTAVTDITSVLSPSFPLFLLLRVLNGLSLTIIYAIVFILTIEFVPPNTRASVNIVACMSWTFGLCILPLIIWLAREWLYMSIISTSSAALLCLYWKILPESPRWLISQCRYDEAHGILCKISTCNSKTAHKTMHLMDKIKAVGEHLKTQNIKEISDQPLDFARRPKLRMRLILISIAWMCCFIPYYGLQMNVRNLAGNEFLNFFYVAAVEAPASLVMWPLMERIGRRFAAIFAFSLSAVTCLLPVIFTEGYEIIGVVAGLLGKTGVSAAYVVIYMLAPELFPTSLRAVGLGICSTVGTGSALICPYIVYLAKYGVMIPYFCFAILSAAGIVAILYLDETMGKELPQSVRDVEDCDSDQSLCACFRSATKHASSNISTKFPLAELEKQRTASKEANDIYRKRGSTESLQGIFIISQTEFKS